MYAKDSAKSWYEVFEREQLLSEYSAVQPWSKGAHFPAVIAKVEYYSEHGDLLADWHQVILGAQVRAFPTYDDGLAWAMNEIRRANGLRHQPSERTPRPTREDRRGASRNFRAERKEAPSLQFLRTRGTFEPDMP